MGAARSGPTSGKTSAPSSEPRPLPVLRAQQPSKACPLPSALCPLPFQTCPCERRQEGKPSPEGTGTEGELFDPVNPRGSLLFLEDGGLVILYGHPFGGSE